MDWWANIIQTLSLLLALAAFAWAYISFGRSRARVELEVTVFRPRPLDESLGQLIPVAKMVLGSSAPGLYESLRAKWPTIHPLLVHWVPQVVAGSPFLMRVWPSAALMFNESPHLSVTIHNSGVSAFSVRRIELGTGRTWREVAPHMVLQRLTDTLPATVGAGKSLEVWFAGDVLLRELAGARVDLRRIRVRVSTSSRGVAKSDYIEVSLP